MTCLVLPLRKEPRLLNQMLQRTLMNKIFSLMCMLISKSYKLKMLKIEICQSDSKQNLSNLLNLLLSGPLRRYRIDKTLWI